MTENDSLVQAMREDGQRITRSLHPTGAITLRKGRIEKFEVGGPVHKRFEVDLHGMSVQYDKFPYPINRISGSITVVDRHWTFANLHGYHGSSEIRAGGDWQPMPAGQKGGTLTFAL